MAPAWIHWTDDDWATARDHPSRDTGFDVHVTDLPTASLAPGDRVQFTMFWPEADRWEGTNFAATVADSEKGSDAA
jgi:glucoamylase